MFASMLIFYTFVKSISIQVPVSAALSALTLVVQFYGWLSFFRLVSYKLERRPQSRRPYYEFTGLWHIYGLLSMNAWFWNAIFHIWWAIKFPLFMRGASNFWWYDNFLTSQCWCNFLIYCRNSDVTEKLNQSSAVALLGYSLILAILRTFNVKGEAQRVTAAAPLLAFVTTHILYLNFYKFDHGELFSVTKTYGWSGHCRYSAKSSPLRLFSCIFNSCLLVWEVVHVWSISGNLLLMGGFGFFTLQMPFLLLYRFNFAPHLTSISWFSTGMGGVNSLKSETIAQYVLSIPHWEP